jgi:hypothetical protein
MSDELSVPQVPEATPDDPEDVSWALSTAEAMWARGDHLEGIKWVRRAAEAASEAENDTRALHLAKAAAELAGLISRMSRASVDIEEIVPDSEPILAVAVPPPPPPAAGRPAIPLTKSAPSSVTKQVSTPSRPPAPLPSRTSQPPPMKGKPLGTNSGKGGSVRPPAPNKPKADAPKDRESKRPPRKSRENLDAAARQALAAPRRPEVNPPAPAPPAAVALVAVEKDVAPNRVAPRDVGNNDPTIVGHVDGIIRPKTAGLTEEPSADAWDASPTQDLTGEDVPAGPFPAAPFAASSAKTNDGDRATAVGLSRNDLQAALAKRRVGGAAGPPSTPASTSSPPATVAGASLSQSPLHASVGPASAPTPGRGPSTEPHDPGLLTSQAVRVVVWRDGSGVHVAPAGTVVSAITVEAVLVALEPNADLTAWLSQRSR